VIKINLLADDKAKAKRAKSPTLRAEGGGRPGQNLLLAGILVLSLAGAAGWWWSLSGQVERWKVKHAEADKELEHLAEVRKKGEEYKARKELLARKIELITELKKRQTLPVHILDQVSRNLPEFLWLESMSASQNKITLSGRATTYNAVTNFYNNLTRSGYFEGVDLGRTFEASDGVSFSLTCSFRQADTEPAAEPDPASEG
jgi:type IV pilus assembly protein PilN